VSIRPATERDEDALRVLWEAFQDEVATPDFLRESWEDAWNDLRRHVSDGLAFVSASDGRIDGFVFATIPRETPRLCHVTDLYVAPDARRAGLARALLHTLLTEVAGRGIEDVGLDVRVDNVAATTLYRNLGFVDHERFMIARVETVLERSARRERPPSFASTHVQTDDRAGVERALAQFLPRLGGSAWSEVTPARNGWVTVVDELCDRDRSAQRRLGAELSDRMGVPIVALALEEEAVVRFLLFERGRMVDEYLSVPTYYGALSKADELALAANPTLVARLTGANPARVRAVARIASSPDELPPARELLAAIAEAMGLEVPQREARSGEPQVPR
jgi:ribosomal protein S18 acetylase RimI-like enzyme